MKILIVDDSKLNLQHAKDVIKKNNINCDVETSNSPVEAMEIIKEGSIDIVLLDIIMPVMTGLEVLQEIRSHPEFKDLIVLMFTSLNDKTNLQKSFELGANDYITKPIEEIEFISRVKAAIRIKANQNTVIEALKMLEKQNDRLKRTTIQLRETQYQLIQKEKLSAIGSLAAGIAHEINNPLGYLSSNYESLNKYIMVYKAVVKSYKELIVELKIDANEVIVDHSITKTISLQDDFEKLKFIDEDIEELLTDSRDGIDKVSKIVKSLLNFSSTDLSSEATYNSIEDIIDEVIIVLGNDYKKYTYIEKTIETNREYLCSRGELSQVFFNIILNAIQGIKSRYRNGRGQILIKIYEESGYINCKITDNGPGIKPEIVKDIFNPFFTTKDVGEGTGLGLSVCYDLIVNKYNGEINVESEINKGSAFTVKLPF